MYRKWGPPTTDPRHVRYMRYIEKERKTVIDARKFLEDLTAESAPEPQTKDGDWRDTLTPAERELFPEGWKPPTDWLALVLKARELCGGEIVHVGPRWTLDDLPGVWRELYEERAAIREYDGGQAREHAEAEALTETIAAMRAAGEPARG